MGMKVKSILNAWFKIFFIQLIEVISFSLQTAYLIDFQNSSLSQINI